MTSSQVLLVEDNPLDRRLIQSYFAKMNMGTLTCAPCLSEALDLLAQGGIDLVLLDLCLPDSEDLRTFTEVHSRAPELPIIVLTGTDDEALALQAMQSGAQDYLFKGTIDSKLLERSMRYSLERKRAEGNILSYQQELRDLADELTVFAQRERKRVATLLHDNIGQLLAIARLKLGFLQTQVSPEAIATVKELQANIDEAIRYTRTLIGTLSPPILHELGLDAALEWLCEQFSESHGLNIVFQGLERRLCFEEEREELLFWTVRELLINAIKHAQASEVSVRLRVEEPEVLIRVEDDGRGFDVSTLRHRLKRAGGFGLFSIQERVHRVGGKLEMISAPGQGTRITIRAPIH